MSIALLAVLGLGALVPVVLRVRLEQRLGAAASAVAGEELEVRCQSFGQAFVDAGAELGYVRFDASGRPEPWTLIKRDQCRDLADYVGSTMQTPTRAQVVAVHTLTHETVHMMGIPDEAKTECLAVQLDAEMARRLGASEDAARRLADTYFREVYPLMPPGYRSDECGPGGELDMGSPDAPW